MARYIFLLVAMVVIAACDQGLVYEDKFTIDFTEWVQGDVKRFEFEAPKIDQRYNLYLHLRHDDTYPFENIYLHLKTHFPSGEMVEDQLSLEMFGKHGQSRCFNSTCSLTALLQPNFQFREVGKHVIEIDQYSRQDTLPGIYDIGISLVQVD